MSLDVDDAPVVIEAAGRIQVVVRRDPVDVLRPLALSEVGAGVERVLEDQGGEGLVAHDIGPFAAGGLIEAGALDGRRAPRPGQVEVLNDVRAVVDGAVVGRSGQAGGTRLGARCESVPLDAQDHGPLLLGIGQVGQRNRRDFPEGGRLIVDQLVQAEPEPVLPVDQRRRVPIRPGAPHIGVGVQGGVE
jgi:hypothetical protein